MNDLKFALRQLLKNPGFTAVAVLTLALGIGVNTAMFSVVNGVVLRPLPYPDADRLVEISQSHRQDPALATYMVSGPNFKDWKAQSRSFDGMSAYQWPRFVLTGGDEPLHVNGARILADFLPLMGIQPALGRGLVPEDETSGGVVLIAHDLWQQRFGGDPAVLGKSVTLDTNAYTVVGILPPGFRYPVRAQVWVPLSPDGPFMRERSHRMGGVVARLKCGVSLVSAQVELDTLARQLEQQYPSENRNWGARITSLHERTVRNVRPALMVLLGAVGFVLLLACANLANLMLSRAAVRQKEFAIRAALGASPGRVLRLCLTESMLLSAGGGAAGLLGVFWSIDLLLALLPGNIPRVKEISLDAQVLGFTAAVSLGSGLLFGIAPAWQMARPNLNETLKEGGHQAGAGLGRGGLQRLLVVWEVALAMVLLIGAGLALKSFLYLQRVDLGVDVKNLLAVEIPLADTRYPTDSQRLAFFQQVLERIRALPNVQTAAATSQILGRSAGNVGIKGRPKTEDEPAFYAGLICVTPDYFKTLGIPLLKGRWFTAEDRPGAPEVVIINETMALRVWPGEDAIGKQVTPGDSTGQGRGKTVIGVVKDVRYMGPQEGPEPDMFLPCEQSPFLSAVVVRTTGDPLKLAPLIRSQIALADKNQPVQRIYTIEEELDQEFARPRFYGQLLGAFAALAFALAVVGIYGVMAHMVARNRREIGVRMALGAQKRHVLSLVIGQGMKPALAGVGLGLLAALALTRFLRTLLYGVEPTDPLAFLGVALLLAGVALLACWLPARRAAKVDPMEVLRTE